MRVLNMTANLIGKMANAFGLRPTAPSVAASSPATFKICCLGDSNTQGFSFGRGSSGYRTALYTALRRMRGDFDFVGPLHTYLDLDATNTEYDGAWTAALGLWNHAGYSGKKIEDLTGLYAGTIVPAGTPDIVILMIGTNNITAGDSLATMKTKMIALLSTIQSTTSAARVIVSTINQFAAGSVTGGNFATWQAAAIAFNSWLVDTTAAGALASYGPNFVALDPCSALGAADFNSEGTHLNECGYGALGAAYAVIVDRIMGQRFGLTFPRPFRQQAISYSLKLEGPADFAQFTNQAFNPVSGDFFFSIDYYPTALGVAGTNLSISQHSGNGTGWSLFANGNGITFDMLGVHVIAIANNQAEQSCLQVNRWHEICVIGNRAAGLIALFVNGQKYTVASGVAAWSVAGSQNTYLGSVNSVKCAPGYYSRVRMAKGSAPDCRLKSTLDTIEAMYFDGTPMPGASCYYKLDEGTSTSLVDSVSGGAAGVVASGAAYTTGWGQIAHPWAQNAASGGAAPAESIKWTKAAADGAAATTTAETLVGMVASPFNGSLRVMYLPSAALTASDTDYATITVKKYDGIGGGAATLCAKTTQITGGTGNWSARQVVDLGTGFNSLALPVGSVLTVTIAKTGNGVVVPDGQLVVIGQPQ